MHPIIDHLNRYVSNIEKHILFYQNILEYELLEQGLKKDGTKYAILKGYNHELFISENKLISNERNIRHIGYLVENIDELFEKLQKNGYSKYDLKIIEKPYSRQIYIKDPDEFEIDFIQWTNKDKFYKNLKKHKEEMA